MALSQLSNYFIYTEGADRPKITLQEYTHFDKSDIDIIPTDTITPNSI